MILTETHHLADDIAIPRLGLGTSLIEDAAAAHIVRDAVRLGYRHIDTAQANGNERGVGEGIRSCGLARDELFVTTKLTAPPTGYEGAKRAIRASLHTLGLAHVDLMLIHRPQPQNDVPARDRAEEHQAAWQALVEARQAGLVRAIGVSNFDEDDLDDLDTLLEGTDAVPQINQLPIHPGNTPANLMRYCDTNGILVEAHSPVPLDHLLRHPELTAMAERYGVTIAQLCIRYTLLLGAVSLPTATNPHHLRRNTQVEFQISDADMRTLITLDTPRHSIDRSTQHDTQHGAGHGTHGTHGKILTHGRRA